MAKKVETCSGGYEAMYLWSMCMYLVGCIIYDKKCITKLTDWHFQRKHSVLCELRTWSLLAQSRLILVFKGDFLNGSYCRAWNGWTIKVCHVYIVKVYRGNRGTPPPNLSPALDEGELSTSRPEPELVRTFQAVLWTLNSRPVRSLFTILTELF